MILIHSQISTAYFWETHSKGTSHARFETEQECGTACKWEYVVFHEGNGFQIDNGVIAIKTAGFYSITAQLHNRKGGDWIGTNILVNERVRSRCEGKYSALVSYKAKLDVFDTIKISHSGSDIHEGNDCGSGSKQPCHYYNYLEIMLYTI